MDFLVKEVLYLLDYEDNIKETLFISTDKRTPGYAYEINIKDYNTGYSDLSFKMPCDIINENGEKEKNPKLALLVPLSKVRYNRTIRYMGKEKISVPEPDGGTRIFPEEDGNRLLENYTMDYIIQPLDKSRQGIGISLTYTAIDFPRFNLSKKKVGLTFNENTITTQELSLYKNTPLSVPGSIQYIPWLEDGKPATWDPNAQAKTYPLDEDAIKKLVNETHFSYGILATVYYWPVTSSGRFEGVWYEEGGFITLSLYNTYAGSDWEGSDYLESITHDWGHLDPIEHYLGPNNACNYLRYILKDTNWKVAGHQKLFIKNTKEQPWFAKGTAPSVRDEGTYYIEYQDLENGKYETTVYRSENGKWEKQTDKTFEQIVNTDINDKDFGMLYDIDIEQVEVSRSAEASLGQTLYTDARYSLSVSNANCYNAITSEAKLFNLYPVFNCIKRTVSLKLNVGKDYGLTYRYKSNLKNSSVKVDGEKVITKLYVTGGTDAQGDQNITIGEANRITSGTPANLSTAANGKEYLKTTMISQIEKLEENIYQHITGVALANSVNMSNQKFKLTFPDNLYESEKATTTNTTTKIIGFSSGKSINKIYDPTGADKCYYIYIRHNKDDDYKDEKNQLYKFDGANITLRRNLEEYFLKDIGTVNYIAKDQTNITNNIKYCPALDSRVTQDGNMYIGTAIDYSTKDGAYTLSNINTNESFVLVGPDRVYRVPTGTTATYNYGVGNYYYIEDTNTYRYCAIQYTDTTSAYSKINNISVSGYVFVEMGAPTNLLYITTNGVKCKVIKMVDDKPVELTLADWLVNDFSLRVSFNGENLVAGGSFDPNADEYITSRSPYGTSYIYNFKYLYDNGWMTEADILDIYAKNKELNDLNLEFYDRYTKDLVNIQAAYNDAINNYDIYSSKADAQLEALMSQYWVNPNKASDGQFSAFPGMPADVNTDNYDDDKAQYFMDITYEEPQGDGTTKTMVVKRVYFNVFNTKSCDKYPSCKDNKTVADNPYTEGQYHVVAKALGWENNYEDKLTINSEIGGYTESEDPSKTADSYNKFVKQMKDYYYRALEADKQMVEAQAALDALMERYKEWEEQVAQIEKYLQENYGEYIIEGSYSNDEQPYANLLLKDGLDASDKYATPDITYTVGVVDASGLIEYRAPHKLICNDLIKRLHGVGQIAPHVGDYVAIQDEPMGMYGVAGLITQIGRRIDNPYQNTITIDTSYTDADELVGNIITATNTVLNNKDIYGRAAIINNKGELSSTTVTNALSSGKNSISIVSTSGKVAVDDNGLTCTNPHNQNEIMRYNGTGILGSQNGGATWRELLTQDGINANYINAGTINASKVSITDGGHDITVMNADGLVVKSQANKPYVLGNLGADGVTKDFENITVFVGRAANGEGVGYFNGYINATKGGNIGGWNISPTKLSSGSGNKYVGISSDGNYAFWAGSSTASTAPFWVKADGSAHFTNVVVDGQSSIDGSNIQSGSISNDQIAANTITAAKIVDGTITASELADRTITGVKIGQNVIAAEHIVANTITAGQIAANAITAEKIAAEAITADKIKAGAITASKVSSDIITTTNFSAQSINANNITSGNITGRTIRTNWNEDEKAYRTELKSDGTFKYYNGVGYLTCGRATGSNSGGTNHPWLSGLNVNYTNGISLRNGNNWTSSGDEIDYIRHSGSSMRIHSGGGMNISATNIALDSSYSSSNYVRINHIYACSDTSAAKYWISFNGTASGSPARIRSNGSNLCLYAASGSAVYAGGDTSGDKVSVSSSGPSSLNVKTNLQSLDNEYDILYEEMKAVKAYNYDYKYKNVKDDLTKDYGFIIDEIEDTEHLSKYFRHYNTTKIIDENNALQSIDSDNPEQDLSNTINIKTWERDAYIKGLFVMIKTLQHKIDKLEEQIKKEKTH